MLVRSDEFVQWLGFALAVNVFYKPEHKEMLNIAKANQHLLSERIPGRSCKARGMYYK